MPTTLRVNDALIAVVAYRKAAHLKDLPALRAALRALAVSGLPERNQVEADLAMEAALVADAQALTNSGANQKNADRKAISSQLTNIRHRIDATVGPPR